MFYRKFEDTFRGTKESVKQKQQVYLDFLLPILKDTPKKVIDLGCGRGEFVDLLQEHGIEAVGVDIDKHMANDNDVIIMDALEYLQAQADNSAILITSFHMIEHIPFEKLTQLIREAYRVLDANGILILETPNPQNIRVASEYFYLDPTHIRPIPKDLLKFTIEHYNFQAQILQLHQPSLKRNVTDIFRSPFDYAIVASKQEIPQIVDNSLSLDEILWGIEDREKALYEQLHQMQENIQSLQATIHEVKADAQQAWQNYIDILNSRSFRLTKPLREFVLFAKKLRNYLKTKFKKPRKFSLRSKRAKEIYQKLLEHNKQS
ncbi:MAG: class I SAM-dependent methyltransferase [Epsilonproteobacteria bacterium]|nr:class I SAM-dependent methyltransferase [Campylobacterota bacterium]